ISVNPDAIRKLDPSVGFPQTVLEVGSGLLSIDVDTAAGKIYYGQWTGPTIRRCNLDGTGDEQVTIGNIMQYPALVRVNPPANKILWGDQSADLIGATQAGGDQFIVTTTPFHRGLFVDTAAQRIYWSVNV